MELAARWLGEKRNFQWLDLGTDPEELTPFMVKAMTLRDTHLVRLFALGTDQEPIGLVALSNVHRRFRTGMLWYVLGDRGHEGRGYTTRAVHRFLTEVFREAGIHAVHAWAVEENQASVRILIKNGFRPIGRQRQCHHIDGRAYDRLLFDLLASEHGGVDQ